jgi:hypothetical protein
LIKLGSTTLSIFFNGNIWRNETLGLKSYKIINPQ